MCVRYVSREEAKDAEKDFSKIHKDGDGKLSLSEHAAAASAGSSAGVTGGATASPNGKAPKQ
jgi:hypothetical protein